MAPCENEREINMKIAYSPSRDYGRILSKRDMMEIEEREMKREMEKMCGIPNVFTKMDVGRDKPKQEEVVICLATRRLWS